MVLDVPDRISLAFILQAPGQGDMFALRDLRKLREAVSESLAAQKEAAGIKSDGPSMTWAHGEITDEIEIGERSKAIVLERLAALHKSKKLQEVMLSLCEKFGYEPKEA